MAQQRQQHLTRQQHMRWMQTFPQQAGVQPPRAALAQPSAANDAYHQSGPPAQPSHVHSRYVQIPVQAYQQQQAGQLAAFAQLSAANAYPQYGPPAPPNDGNLGYVQDIDQGFALAWQQQQPIAQTYQRQQAGPGPPAAGSMHKQVSAAAPSMLRAQPTVRTSLQLSDPAVAGEKDGHGSTDAPEASYVSVMQPR